MPHSDNQAGDEPTVAGQSLAVLAESLYVANLLILPFLAFIVLAVIFLKKRHGSAPLARSHLEQTMSASIAIAIMFFVCSVIVLLLKTWGMEDVTLWIFVVLIFTIIHATMVLLGVLGLAKAMSGKCFRYPVFGYALPPGCPE